MRLSNFIRGAEVSSERKSQWVNSEIRAFQMAAIRLNKEPVHNRVLSGIMQVSQQPSSNAFFQTKSVFATNVPCLSVISHTASAKKKLHKLNSTRHEKAEEEVIITCFATRRSKSEKKIRSIPSSYGVERIRHKRINDLELKQIVLDAKNMGGRVLNVLCVQKNGLRYDLRQSYIIAEDDNLRKNASKEFKQQIKEKLQLGDKRVYLFHLNREPISKLLEIHSSEYSIFVDVVPKLEIPLELYGSLNDQISLLEGKVKRMEDQLPAEEQEQENVIDIEGFADQLIDNPHIPLEIETKAKRNHAKKQQQIKDILRWYDQGIREFGNRLEADKDLNPVSSMDQKVNQLILKQTRVKLESFPFINNPHKYKLTAEQIRLRSHELKQRAISHSKIKDNVSVLKTSKETNRQLILKHSLASSQNMPYMIEKYNTSRSDIHNLYTLYKSLEQVSNKRITSSAEMTLERGVDRKTFDEGLAGIGYNIGKEVVNTVCSFPDFITWPQFLKIVSISSSKTPEQKLQSILKYVSQDSNSDFLTRLQIDIMVSACLSKFLGKTDESDFIEMKEYLVESVFKQLDPKNEDKIRIQVLKERVLGEGKETDLISFLFLYSD